MKPHKDPSSYRKAARKEAKAMARSGADRLAEAARKHEAAEAAARKETAELTPPRHAATRPNSGSRRPT
jgi:hypothetical protein